MAEKEISLGIIGLGMVGGAVADYYAKKPGFAVKGYDKYKNAGSLADAVAADYVFICLPSPTRADGVQDLSAFDEVFPKLSAGAKVIIKSTVLPGTTLRYQKQFPSLSFLHNPEFLDARTAVRDFAEPDLQVLGYTDASEKHAEAVMALLPSAPHATVCASSESEMVKYFLNTFLATKNTFANQMYDYCAAKNINYDRVKDIVKKAPRIGGEVHLKVFMDGYRGFSGACLPKDIHALLTDARDQGTPLEQLEQTKKLNDQYLEAKENAPMSAEEKYQLS